MAINKVINKSTKSHGAMRNVIEYVLRDEKIKDGYVEITGPFAADQISYDAVYRTWLEEKKLWNKDTGRMYTHNIISFHKDENVSPSEVLEIGKEFADRFFSGYQCVIGVHQDREHLHCHIVTNSVSYIDGKKLHQTRHDLEQQKTFTNTLCSSRGLSVPEKGQHFDGSAIEEGEITAWDKDKYNLLINNSKKSFVAECAIALLEAVPKSTSREEFIAGMADHGWSVQWEDRRKHIVFRDRSGNKVRDTNIEKTFSGMKVNKEALTNEFTRQNELRIANRESDIARATERERTGALLRQYYAELESAAAGLSSAEAIRYDSQAGGNINTGNGTAGSSFAGGQIRRQRDDFGAYLADIDSQEQDCRASIEASIRDSRVERRIIGNAEKQSITGGRQSGSCEADRRSEGQIWPDEPEGTTGTRREVPRSFSRHR